MNRPPIIHTKLATIDSLADRSLSQLDWLGRAEIREGSRYTDLGRRRQWLAGRWIAKQLLLEAGVTAELQAIQILSRNRAGRGVAPQVLIAGERFLGSLSLSHSATHVYAALVNDDNYSIGVDVAPYSATSANFRRLWFTPEEQSWIAEQPLPRTAQLWAIKEAIYKAGYAGEAWTPLHFEVVPTAAGWRCSRQGESIAHLSIKTESHLEFVTAMARVSRIIHPCCVPMANVELLGTA